MTSTESITESIILGPEIVIKSPALINHMIPCGNKIICGMCAESVQLFDIPTCKFTYKLKATGYTDVICCSSAENRIICGYKIMKVFDMDTMKILQSIKVKVPAFSGQIMSITITDSPISGESIIISSTNGVINMHNLNTGELVGKLNNPTEYLKHTLITLFNGSPNNSNYLLAVYNNRIGGEFNIDIIDIATNKCIRTLKGHTNRILNVLTSNNGQFLVSCSWDTTIKIWDTTSWECISTLTCNQSYITIFISPDDKLLISSVAKKIMIWDTTTGQCIKTILDEGIISFRPAIIVNNMIIYGTTEQRIKLIPFTISA
jgi:WD40 repeat protein